MPTLDVNGTDHPSRDSTRCPTPLVRLLRIVKLTLGIVATALGIARVLGVL